MPTDEQLDREFDWTPVEIPRCRDLYSPSMWCNRKRGHDGPHASGFGSSRMRWGGESA